MQAFFMVLPEVGIIPDNDGLPVGGKFGDMAVGRIDIMPDPAYLRCLRSYHTHTVPFV